MRWIFYLSLQNTYSNIISSLEPKENSNFLAENFLAVGLAYSFHLFYPRFFSAFLRVSLSEYSSSVPVESPRPNDEIFIDRESTISFNCSLT